MSWEPIDTPGSRAAVGPVRLAPGEGAAWDAFAAAVLSNIHDRTMLAPHAAEFAANMADAMIIERRKRPIAQPERAPAVAAPAAPAAPAFPIAPPAHGSAAAIGSAAVDGTTRVCECGHATDQHVREAPSSDSYLRCVVPGCVCGKFQERAAVPAAAAGL